MSENSGLHIVEIEVTNRCNLNCKHCYVDKNTLNDLNESTVLDLIDQISKLNIYRLVFTGGEPLLIEKIFNFAIYAKKKNIPQVVLMTNGLLINKKNLKNLKIFDLIQMSIDVPPNEKPHFRIDYFKKLESKIDILKKNNIKIHLQATMSRFLISKLELLSNFSKEKKVTIGINRLILTGNAKDLSKEKLTPLELKEALEKISNIKKDNPLIKCSDPLIFLVDEEKMKIFEKTPKKNILGGCIAGISTLYIKSNGDVLICPFVKLPISNIFKEDIKSIWFNNQTLDKLRNRKNLIGKCGSCVYRSFCGGCRGASLLNYDSLFCSDPNCWL